MTTLRCLLATALLLTGVGCGGGYSSTPVSPSPTTAPPPALTGASSVTIPMGAAPLGNRAFSPDEITVAIGDTVTWVNADAVAHTSTANGGAWDSRTLAPGQQFSATLPTAGTFA